MRQIIIDYRSDQMNIRKTYYNWLLGGKSVLFCYTDRNLMICIQRGKSSIKYVLISIYHHIRLSQMLTSPVHLLSILGTPEMQICVFHLLCFFWLTCVYSCFFPKPRANSLKYDPCLLHICNGHSTEHSTRHTKYKLKKLTGSELHEHLTYANATIQTEENNEKK